MNKKHIYMLLLSLTFLIASGRARFLRLPCAKKELDDIGIKTLAENDLAIKTLAVYDTVADPRIQSFNDLISISWGESLESITMNKCYRPAVGIGSHAPGKLTGPRVSIASSKERVAYVALTASLASSALEIVQDALRALNKPNNRVSYYLEEGHSKNLHNLDDIFFDFKKRKFIVDFADTLKSLDNVREWELRPYFYRYQSYDRLDRNYFSFRELALRPLSCLLIASPDIGDEGKRIAQEILKDKEVLEIIKLQFSTILVNPQFQMEICLNFKDYLMHNSWSKGIANIFDELSMKDQYDIFNSSLQKYVRFFYHSLGRHRDSTIEFYYIYEALDFFQEPQALDKLSSFDQLSYSEQQLTRSVARTLINIVSVPGYLDGAGYYPGIWLFAYYIVEFLMTNKNSRFIKLYQDHIHNTSLIEKIEFLKTFIELNKRANELLPSKLAMKKREGSIVWKQLGEEKIMKWFKQYFRQLNALERDFNAKFNQIGKHLRAYENSISHPELYNRSSKEYVSSQLGALLNTKIIKYFFRRDIEKPTLEEAQRKQYLKIINKAARRLKMKEQKKQKRRGKEEQQQRFRKVKTKFSSFFKKHQL
ncbi:expressed protein [Phakopsora pachyrhizi]|uniref:Expressed protein n=1 Tax=Phakopsora pachyrhizi TaxID=170000 RepID=A0AAV0BMB8_PHAPC|nr:expressed protein [Phakopsora pachyrhizi]